MTDTQTRADDRVEAKPDRRLQRSRRRFARRHWRRRWLAWRYVVLGLLVAGVAAFGLWAVLLSSWLSVTGADVTGTETISPARIRAIADVPVGGPLATVDLAGIGARVSAIAEVASVDVTREWPDQVLIKVTERRPVAYVDLGGSLRAMDDQGVVFAGYKRPPPGLPRVAPGDDIGPDALTDALHESADVLAALPEALSRQVDHVEVADTDGVSLLLRDGTRVVWGSAADSADKARVLPALLGRGKVINLTAANRATTADH